MKMPTPEKEHHWLQQLVGDWTFEIEAPGKTGEAPHILAGIETVRAIGGLWIIAEGKSDMPGGGIGANQLTLGYDTASNCFVDTWVGSMMAYLWIYAGSLDESSNTLTLETEGPGMDPNQSGPVKYRDAMTLQSDNTRTFTSTTLGTDGKWKEVMSSVYQRKM